MLNEFTDDESLSSGQSVFTAQSLNRASLSIRPLSIWLGDSQQQIGPYKGQGGQLIRPLGHTEHSQGGSLHFPPIPSPLLIHLWQTLSFSSIIGRALN